MILQIKPAAGRLTSRWPFAAPTMLLAALAALAIAPSAASAAGTVTVAIQGRGDVTGTGVTCSETAGSDCTESYADTPVKSCEPGPTGKPICFTEEDPPQEAYTAGADRNGYAFAGFDGCDSVSGRSCSLLVTADTTITARFSDQQAPSVSALVPGSGARRGTIPLSVSASDNSGTVSKVEFYVRGALVGSDTSAPYSMSFDTATVSDGAASVLARAYDPTGNASDATSSITIDNTRPSVTALSGPSNQTFAGGTTQTWTFTPQDATSGIDHVECSVVADGQPDSFGGCTSASSESVTNKPNGSYVFTVRAVDRAGNVSDAVSRSFSVDTVPPETSITSGPGDGSSSSATTATWNFASSEPGSTFACRVYPAALTPPAFGGCSAAASHTAAGFAPGTYTFEVRATDAVGNVDATPATRTITVTAPPVSVPDPTPTPNPTPAPTPAPTVPTGTTTVVTTTTTTTVATAPFLPAFATSWSYRGGKTKFNTFRILRIPKGAKVSITCKGKGCPAKRGALARGGATLNLLEVKQYRKLALRPGALLQIRITGPAGDVKLGRWAVKSKKRAVFSTQCAKPGGRLGRCT